jgi:putative salt-induced outer membrane protein
MNMKLTATVSAMVLALASGAALAQTDITGITTLNDQLDDQETAIAKDMARSNDANRFGNPETRVGMSGSASLGYSGQTGNSKSQELNAGARLRYAQGQFVQSLGASINYADSNGVKTKQDVFAVYDANYYVNDKVYGFVLGRIATDGLAKDLPSLLDPTLQADKNKIDAFLGFGPGYRIVNSEQMTWRVQAGLGVSYLENGLGHSDRETGYIASSRFFYSFNPNLFATMDTDILKTKSSLRINNDLGLNIKMTDAFSTRVSYLTEYNDSRAIQSNNKLGVSLVYGF